MNSATIDNHLDDILIKQLCWKPSAMTDAAVSIVERALKLGQVWPDEVDFSSIEDSDRNCIGSAFRVLSGNRVGILTRTSNYRRSHRPESSGRIVWHYELASYSRAKTF